MKYEFEKRIYAGDRIQTYYKTDVKVGDESLTIVKQRLYGGIAGKLGIRQNASQTMAVLTDGDTYTVMFLELISHTYIEYLPKMITSGSKTIKTEAETKLKKLTSELKQKRPKEQEIYLSDLGLDLSGHKKVE